jgi:predicted ArsR family transcriptional regulator
MSMKNEILSLLSNGVLRTNYDMAVELGTTEATVRARISDLRLEGERLVKTKVRDTTYRSAWMSF